ncbi:putative acetamidase regulatory protein [Xylariales sp. PMI_506]|nr:putative acetamidase regulatory protein [Xylariales sp. PMI_506]
MYEKVKVLISLGSEKEPVQTLKVLCLLSFWGGKPSNPVGLDGPWHWTGVAGRLAMQMGLYRESTYQNRANASCLRRIFWQIHNSDSILVACWGRPALLRRSDFDVRLPTVGDFEISNPQAHAFVESTKLCTIFSHISEIRAERRPIQAEELASIEALLADWISQLPRELQLYDLKGDRAAYYRPASEVMIQYFVAIIISEFLRYRDKEQPWGVSIPTLIAASCAAVLYDEIDCRDEAVFLPSATGFFCLATALPLIHYIPQCPGKEAVRKRDLAVLHTILRKMQDRYGDARLSLGLMDGLEKSIEKSSARQRYGNDTVQEPHLYAYARKLFSPLPPTMCENMDLLDLAVSPTHQVLDNNIVPAPNRSTESHNFDHNFMDLFGLDYGNMVFDFENSGNGWTANDQIL